LLPGTDVLGFPVVRLRGWRNSAAFGVVTVVTFAAFGILSSLAAMNKFSMRPYFAAVLVSLSLGVITFSPVLSLAQEHQEAIRKIVSRVDPVYPELASKMQIHGTVKVEAVVAPNGRVKFTQVIGGSPLLARAAVDAIAKWKWGPAPQETKELIQLNFHP
jgi:TonB family protein